MTLPALPALWSLADSWVAEHELVIDRPRGSRHPRYPDYVYPFDYGYLDGTMSADGEGIDVFVGEEPERGVTALLTVLDPQKRDAEVKLMLGCTAAQIDQALSFYQGFALAVPRPDGAVPATVSAPS